MPNLWRYVAKFIYDELNMNWYDIHKMQESIVDWKNAIDLEQEKLFIIQAADFKTFGKIVTTDHKYMEEQFQLENMAEMLKENEEGKFDEQKRMFKLTGVDYRKVFRFAEAYEEKDFIDGAKIGAASDAREGIKPSQN